MMWRDLAYKHEVRGAEQWVWVDAQQWLSVHAALAADGRPRLEHLTAFDDDGMTLVSMVSDEKARDIVRVVCGPVTHVAAIDDVYESASWHQREVAQMFGIVFAGAADVTDAFESAVTGHPLRRGYALDERVDRRWPGAFEPDEAARRRPAPSPGVNPEWSA